MLVSPQNIPSQSESRCSPPGSRVRQVLACSGLLLLASATSAIASPDLSDFELVFSDEFNGSQLDSSKWNTGYLWGPYLPINNEEQLYVHELGINAGSMVGNGGATPSPFEMTGSSLKIIATPVTNQNQLPARPAEGAAIWNDYPEYRYNGEIRMTRMIPSMTRQMSIISPA